MFTLAKFEVREKPICFGLLIMPDDMEVFTYPNVVVNCLKVTEF